MRVFDRAKTLCQKATRAECDDAASEFVPMTVTADDRHEREHIARQIVETRAAEVAAAYALWTLARRRCATENHGEESSYFDQAATLKELERLQALALHKWEKTEDRWQKQFASPAESAEAAAVLDILFSARDEVKNPRTADTSLLVLRDDKAFRHIREAEETAYAMGA